ncbi:DEAD/DEAH box helicase [Jonesiaceae bacterium BS-20]|uniref:DEAD/DEAH box helicase n=1 Tax=Jonesiaceae bacterium BS-20 TaxID=3120821 RepID=A0AAU7E0Q0_9MICO
MFPGSQVFGKDLEFGFINDSVISQRLFHPLLISNSHDNTMLRALRHELRKSDSFVFSVAFITPGALALLKQELLDFTGHGVILTSTYLAFNSPETFRELANLENVEVRVFESDDSAGFHAKGYVFRKEHEVTAIVGSSNLTSNALLKNQEWNIRFSARHDGDIVSQLEREIQAQHALSRVLTQDWIDRYEVAFLAQEQANPQSRVIVPSIYDEQGNLFDNSEIQPNQMQVEALQALADLRARGEKRGIIVSATGTGKTILSALDVRQVAPKRMLFIVHREQILDRAMRDYERVLDCDPQDLGKLTGNERTSDRRYVFATVQSLSKPETLAQFGPTDFDYILIDEVHKAGAESYKRLLDHFDPEFFLGMTATPERTDGINIFELFDFNVPYEIRLQEALEEEMLCPFHYYGVSDYTDSHGQVITDTADLGKLVSNERIEYVLQAIKKYGHAGRPVKGLIFCSRTEEAQAISAELNVRTLHGKLLRTVALTGMASIEERESVVEQLEAGELDYIVTVDIFNEGIDIPSVNQVVMLRQTKSSIIFAQQLGRGLRKDIGKDFLVVIDFIGNYANNFLIPIALFGDMSLSKDSIRRNMINADEAGTIAGISSISFDEVAKELVFNAIAATKLDSFARLKEAFNLLKGRLGTTPKLTDFARFATVDPVVIASASSNYHRFLLRLKQVVTPISVMADQFLSFMTTELLNGKRPHELLLLQALLERGELSIHEYDQILAQAMSPRDGAVIESVRKILTLEFFTSAEQLKYGATPLIEIDGDAISLSTSLFECLTLEPEFYAQVSDLIEAGLFTSRHRFKTDEALLVGERYSRKDVCRLLNWESNQQSTIYGYKVDKATGTCPIFITYHKDDEIDASVKYQDEFLDPSHLTWFTRSRRTLKSKEVQAIVENRPVIHVFAKKDDAEGTDFFYLGTASSSAAQETRMGEDEAAMLPVVKMQLKLSGPIESSLYEYLVTSGTNNE